MMFLLDSLYVALFVGLPYAASRGDLVMTAVAASLLALLDHVPAALELGRVPSFSRSIGRTPAIAAFLAFRHCGVLVAFANSGQGAPQLMGAYLAALVSFLLGSAKWTHAVRGLADAKFPFIVGATAISQSGWRLIIDQNGAERIRQGGRLQSSEVLLALVPLAAVTVGPTAGLVAALAVSIVFLLLFLSVAFGLEREAESLKASALPSVRQRLADLSPEVMLYFSGGKEATFQANMWFSALEQLEKKAIVVFRERHHVPAFAPTSLPLVFVESTRDLEMIVPATVRITLYVSNVGKNLHWLRSTKCKHVFIGHGDSDKASSAHGVMKVYDHMLVAGQAHIDRMEAAGLHMPPEYYIMIGRPQLELFFDRGR